MLNNMQEQHIFEYLKQIILFVIHFNNIHNVAWSVPSEYL